MAIQLIKKIPKQLDVSPDHYIGGRRVASEEHFEVRSPLDWNVLLAKVARGREKEVDMAVRAANEAFPAWAALGIRERNQYVRRLADLIEQNVDRIAEVETLDVGMLERSLRERLVFRSARNYRFYAEFAEKREEPVWSYSGVKHRVVRMPAGPAAIIVPWNAPFMLTTWKTAPALVAGCTVILKPAEWTPLSASILADLVHEAGFPPGVFNVVQGIGEEAGAALTRHPLVRRISLTGSSETGRIIGEVAARNHVPFTGEMGGKSPFIVCEDADLEAAAKQAANQYDDAGQVCFAGTRLIVHEAVADEFLDRFVRYKNKHVLGDPRDEKTTIAPLVHPEHLKRVDGFIKRARENGDRIMFGGAPVEGLWYEPTLVIPRSNESEIVQREVFGPVLTFQTFADESEAVYLANSTRYGLGGLIYTSSSERAERLGRAIRTGLVWVNTFAVRDLKVPFGGTGISGIGREGGGYALDFYSDLKALLIREGSTECPSASNR